jgi:hypothetical protein
MLLGHGQSHHQNPAALRLAWRDCHARYYTIGDIRALLRLSGLVVEEERYSRLARWPLWLQNRAGAALVRCFPGLFAVAVSARLRKRPVRPT